MHTVRGCTPAIQKVPDWQTDLDDDEHVAITLDVINMWSSLEQFCQIRTWSETGMKYSKKLEKVFQDSCHYLKCKPEGLTTTMVKAIEEGGKEKAAALEKQKAMDQNQIKALEKKVEELAKIDEMDRNLVELAHLVRKFLAFDPKLMISNNLLKEVLKPEDNPKLVKIITCNKKYAGEIKDVISRLSHSLGETMEYLIKHKKRLSFRVEQQVAKSSPELKRVLGISGTRAKSLFRL